jgi:hypothetical protein
MRGRKTKQESRAAELRQKLVEWSRVPESARPSLRALARELGASHQLLQHYLDGLEEWECKERYQKAKEKAQKEAVEIRARAEAEGREMTMRECLDVIVIPGVHDRIERIRQDARHGPLDHWKIQTLKLHAKQFPEAKEILGKCRQMTPQEERQARASERAAAFAAAAIKTIKRIKQDGERGPLCWQDIERLKYLARRKYPEAKELLQKYSQTAEPKPKLGLSAQTAALREDTAKAATRRYETLADRPVVPQVKPDDRRIGCCADLAGDGFSSAS